MEILALEFTNKGKYAARTMLQNYFLQDTTLDVNWKFDVILGSNESTRNSSSPDISFRVPQSLSHVLIVHHRFTPILIGIK
jgi:hypothetical protein